MFINFIFECGDFNFSLKGLLLADFVRRDWFTSSFFGKIHQGEFQISCGDPEKFEVDDDPREENKEDGDEVDSSRVFFDKVAIEASIFLEQFENW